MVLETVAGQKFAEFLGGPDHASSAPALDDDEAVRAGVRVASMAPGLAGVTTAWPSGVATRGTLLAPTEDGRY